MLVNSRKFFSMEAVVPMMLLVVLLFSFVITKAANIGMLNDWLHHEMEPLELNHHFGVDSPTNVNPQMYQVIQIHIDSDKPHIPEDTNDENVMIVKKRTESSQASQSIKYEAFGFQNNILLERNENILSAAAKLVFVEKYATIEGQMPENTNCHFLHNSENISAALSNCGDGFSGSVIQDGYIFEVKHLNKRMKLLLAYYEYKNHEKYHIITRKSVHELPDFEKNELPILKPNVTNVQVPEETIVKRSEFSDLTVEVGIFFDKFAYELYMSYYNSEDKIVNMLLAFMNQIQAMYHFKSLGRKVDFTIVHLELMKASAFPEHGGERLQLLTEFCKYQSRINIQDDSNPNHWDIALLLSSLDFYTGNSKVTMGLAPEKGVCDKLYNCVIGEIGTSETATKPYPSTGFTSAFVAAHEIGHNLGMPHDDVVGCSKNGYVMSPSRGTKGEVTWSKCSARIIENLNKDCLMENNGPKKAKWDHFKKYHNVPGEQWSRDEQCQFLLRDPEAMNDHKDANLPNICTRLYCKSPNREGYFAAGPALEGTRCSTSGKVCHAGKCIEKP